jgi:hypothetical protein
MSIQITTAFVEQYKANVYHLLQQKGSKLRPYVRQESVTGNNAFFEQIGSTSARRRTSRHSDTPRMDVPHARRRVSLNDYDWAELIDDEDKVRMLIDPAGPYAEAGMWAMGRAIDDEIITAFDAVAYTGANGSIQTPFDTNMIVDVQTVWPGVSAADTGLNIAKLIECRKKLGANEVDPDEEVYVAVNARQISSLLKDERVISGDYNSALPLISGKVSRVGGCTLIPCNRIGVDTNGDDKCYYWTKSGMLLALGKEMTTRVSERADKNYATQVFNSMTVGATRMEEGRVGYIECDPGASPTTDAS